MNDRNREFNRTALLCGLWALGLVLLGHRAVYSHFPNAAARWAGSLSQEQFNRWEAERLTRGYYENLDDTFRFNTELTSIYSDRPRNWQPLGYGALRWRGDLLVNELMPSVEATYLGQPLHTNRWGMRGRDYEKLKPSGVVRIAVLGSSYAMGRGVADEDTFEARLEARLNQAHDGRRYEVLNFAVDGYSPVQQPQLLAEKVLSFSPDVVLYAANASDPMRASQSLSGVIRLGIDIADPELRAIVDKAGVVRQRDPQMMPQRSARATVKAEGARQMGANSVEKKLKRVEVELAVWSYRRLAEECRGHGIVPLWALLPMGEALWYGDPNHLAETAASLGFVTVDVSHAFDDADLDEITLTEWDRHPNAAGQALLAEKLFSALQRQATQWEPPEKRHEP